MRHWFDDDTNGIIIGQVTFPYEFWTRDKAHKIAADFFENDDQAIAWFRERYPAEFKTGVEMRVFDVAEKDDK